MTNNLRRFSQDLRAFAKRTKDFKYTESALITFLITGMIFSARKLNAAPKEPTIESQRKSISTSITDMRQNFKRVKAETKKLIKDSNMELIQLMEQGDHVTKSPWSTWQFGQNFFYDDNPKLRQDF